jgi:biotin synthase-related radical SAM superfamily protein
MMNKSWLLREQKVRQTGIKFITRGTKIGSYGTKLITWGKFMTIDETKSYWVFGTELIANGTKIDHAENSSVMWRSN